VSGIAKALDNLQLQAEPKTGPLRLFANIVKQVNKTELQNGFMHFD